MAIIAPFPGKTDHRRPDVISRAASGPPHWMWQMLLLWRRLSVARLDELRDVLDQTSFRADIIVAGQGFAVERALPVQLQYAVERQDARPFRDQDQKAYGPKPMRDPCGGIDKDLNDDCHAQQGCSR